MTVRDNDIPRYADVGSMLDSMLPAGPVYCVYPRTYESAAGDFLNAFPGRVVYAVKANNEPAVLRALIDAGVRCFDCASLPEIDLVKHLLPDARCYFMTPVRLRNAARIAQQQYGVRHFMIDDASGLEPLLHEIDPDHSVIFARMAVHHESALEDLSSKFGAPPIAIPRLLESIRDSGAEPALAFNVGSGVTNPDAYRYAIGIARDVMNELPFRLRLVDIGGGFPYAYPGFPVPPLNEYFDAISEAAAALPLSGNGELLAEPGRALSAPGLSAVVQVLLRKDERLYLNDGMYGAFWELRFRGHKRYPARVFRNGQALVGDAQTFTLFGPTCDSSDRLPATVELPESIAVGDYIEFGSIGAYSLSGRTAFNGFYSDTIVTIDGSAADPPA